MSGATRLNYGGSVTAIAEVIGEDHTGNAGAVVTLDSGYSAGTTRVYFNGVRLNDGGANDYIETDPSLGTITLLGTWESPGPSDVILVDYMTYAGITDAAYFPYVSSDVATGSLIYRYGAQPYRYVGLSPGASGKVLTISASGTPAWESMGLSNVLSRGNSFGSYPGLAAGGFFQSSGISFTLGGSSTVFGNGGMGRYAGPSSFYPSTDLIFETPSTSGETVTIPNRTGILVLDTDISSTYLPLAGGTLSGGLIFSSYTTLALSSVSPTGSGAVVWVRDVGNAGTLAVMDNDRSWSYLATENYVGDWYVPLSGGQLSGDLIWDPDVDALTFNFTGAGTPINYSIKGGNHCLLFDPSGAAVPAIIFTAQGGISATNFTTNSVNYASGTGQIILAKSGDSLEGIPQPSSNLGLYSSTWSGSSTEFQNALIFSRPQSGANNAFPEVVLKWYHPGNTVPLDHEAFAFSLNATGSISNISFLSGNYRTRLSSQVSSSDLTVSLPATSGTLALTSDLYKSSTGSAGLNDTFTLGGSSFVIENGLIVSRT